MTTTSRSATYRTFGDYCDRLAGRIATYKTERQAVRAYEMAKAVWVRLGSYGILKPHLDDVRWACTFRCLEIRGAAHDAANAA